MSKKNSHSANKILERAKLFLNLRTNVELANALNVKPNTLSTWKKREKVDHAALFSICDGINLNWLLYGTGPMHDGGQLDTISGKVVAMLESMDENQKRDVLRYTEKEKLFCELQHEMEKKKAV